MAQVLDRRDVDFVLHEQLYEGQVRSARFFINSILPVTLGKMSAILADDGTIVDISEDSFGGK